MFPLSVLIVHSPGESQVAFLHLAVAIYVSRCAIGLALRCAMTQYAEVMLKFLVRLLLFSNSVIVITIQWHNYFVTSNTLRNTTGMLWCDPVIPGWWF